MREEVEDAEEDVEDDEDVEVVADAGVQGVGGDRRRCPTIDVARVPSAAAWLAALALVTWSNRWATPLGDEQVADARPPRLQRHVAELGTGRARRRARARAGLDRRAAG